MSESLPVFTQRPVPQERDQWGGLELPLAKWPRCSCGEAGPIDDATGLCRACWRTGPWSAWWVGRNAVLPEEPAFGGPLMPSKIG